jgi:hypothetical protein
MMKIENSYQNSARADFQYTVLEMWWQYHLKTSRKNSYSLQRHSIRIRCSYINQQSSVSIDREHPSLHFRMDGWDCGKMKHLWTASSQILDVEKASRKGEASNDRFQIYWSWDKCSSWHVHQVSSATMPNRFITRAVHFLPPISNESVMSRIQIDFKLKMSSWLLSFHSTCARHSDISIFVLARTVQSETAPISYWIGTNYRLDMSNSRWILAYPLCNQLSWLHFSLCVHVHSHVSDSYLCISYFCDDRLIGLWPLLYQLAYS